MKTVIRFALPYLVFPSSFFSMPFSIGASFAGSPAFCSPAGAAASGAGAGTGAGSAGAGAGGGGGGGSSFLPHPAKVRVKAKSVINDNENIFLPILRFTSFPVTHLANLFWLSLLYRTSLSEFQGQPQKLAVTTAPWIAPRVSTYFFPRRFLDNPSSEFARPTSKTHPCLCLRNHPIDFSSPRTIALRSRAFLRRQSQTGKIVCMRGHCSNTNCAQSPARSKLNNFFSAAQNFEKIPKELFSNKKFNAGAAARNRWCSDKPTSTVNNLLIIE
jgi:hypothetical protein